MNINYLPTITATFQVVAPIGSRVKFLACFTNLYDAIGYAEIYTLNNHKTAFVSTLQVIHATAGGAR